MFHDKREWQIVDVPTLEELAKKLVENTWCCCNGFRSEGLLLLNDATSEDGAQEYAVVREGPPAQQIESLTVSWYESEALLLDALKKLASSSPPSFAREVVVRTHKTSERCRHCA